MNANENISWMGWKNHETWLAQMWLKLDEKTYNGLKTYANTREATCDLNEAVVEVAAYIKQIVANNCPNLGSNMYYDLLNDSLERVDYYEIAQRLLSD